MGVEVNTMEVKKTQQSSTTNSVDTKKKVQDFVSDLKSEVTKVSWTSKEELITYSKIVVGATFLFGMAIYFMDLIIQGTLNGLDALLRIIAG